MRFLLILLLALAPLQVRADALTVFAAASLTDAMKQISDLWVKAGHEAPRLSFASSSTLARQIEQGAPVNVFASADQQWMDYLAKKDLIAAGTRKDLLGNDLVLVVPATHPIHVNIGPGFDLAAMLGPDGRLSTGDPAPPCLPGSMPSGKRCASWGCEDKPLPRRLAPAADVRVSPCCWSSGAKHRPALSIPPMRRLRRRCRSRACSQRTATIRSPTRLP